jgi:hypothetical protein
MRLRKMPAAISSDATPPERAGAGRGVSLLASLTVALRRAGGAVERIRADARPR